MELTIEHLAPYLPHDLEIVVHGDGWDIIGCDIMMNTVKCVNPASKPRNFRIKDVKPILRPLSQLTEEIEHGGRKFVPLNELWDGAECDAERDWIDQMRVINLEGNDAYKVIYAPYSLMYNLISWHFDIYGLIDNGLAIEKD